MNDELEITEEIETQDEVQEESLSIEDEVKRAYAELTDEDKEPSELEETFETKDNESRSDTKEENQASEETTKRPRGRPRKAADSEETPEKIEIDPPSDWDAEGKETFKELPVVAQQQIKRIADEYQNWRRRTASEQARVVKEYETKSQELEAPLRVIRNFLPRWGAEGMTPESALAKMCAFNELVIRDPDAAIEQLAEVTGRQISIANRKSSESQNNSLTQRPVDVNAEVERIINERMVQAQAQTLAQRLDEAHINLKNKVGADGRFQYPDLHSPQFESELVPLVERILGSNPNLTPEVAIERAYKALDGRVITSQTSMTTSPTGTNRSNGVTARRAALSVSGSYGSGKASIPEAKPGESIEDTVARTYGYLFNR